MIGLIFGSQEVIAYITKLIEYTEPLITADWQQTNLPFPFDGFTKEAHPEVKFYRRHTFLISLYQFSIFNSFTFLG